MSDFWGISKNLIWDKFKLMNWVLAIDVIAIVVIFLINLFKGGNTGFNYVSMLVVLSLMVANFVSFILLSRRNERVLTSSNYRLVPVSDTKLYLSNILTTFLAMAYLWVVETVVSIVVELGAMLLKDSEYAQFNSSISLSGILSAFQFLLFMALSIIAVWSGITLIHFIINLVSGFLPFGRQKFVLFLVYLVVIGLVLWAFNYVMYNIFSVFLQNGFEIDSIKQVSSVLWISSGIACVWAVVFSGVNIYLMKRWVETVR